MSFNALAVMFGLCPATPPFGVIPCDTGCTGSSAFNMASQVSSYELQMVSEFNNLNSLWVDASNADSELILSYMQKKLLTSNQRMAAYSGVEAKVNSAVVEYSKEGEFIRDNLSLALQTVSKNTKVDRMQKYIATHHGATDVETRIPFMLLNSPLLSDPINSKDSHTELLVGWAEIIRDYSKKEADTLVLSSNDVSLASISLGEDKLSLAVSSEISKLLAYRHLSNMNSISMASEKRKLKDMMAINLLLQSFDVDPLVGSANTPIDIAKNWFVSIESQKSVLVNKPRDLFVDLLIGQGIENTLMNDYLTLKKGKNLVRALN